ncbi:hypothetical protein WKT22_03992 [Candidatus Lokiarchaeum ossiferum]
MQMVEAIILSFETKEKSFEILTQYPSDFQMITSSFQSLHDQLKDHSSNRVLTYKDDLYLFSAYSFGSDQEFSVIFVHENPEANVNYEKALIDLTTEILIGIGPILLKTPQKVQSDSNLVQKIENILISNFKIGSLYLFKDPNLQLLLTMRNPLKRAIFQILRKNGSIAKKQLIDQLQIQFSSNFLNVDAVLHLLTNDGFIKQKYHDDLLDVYVYLVSDLLLYRVPPLNLADSLLKSEIKNDLEKQYLQELIGFFKSYQFDERYELETVVPTIFNLDIYSIIHNLRVKLFKRIDLEHKLYGEFGQDSLNLVLHQLFKAKFITIMNDEMGREIIGLISEFKGKKFTPLYLLEILQSQYQQKYQVPQVILQHLFFLLKEGNEIEGKLKKLYDEFIMTYPSLKS